MLGTIFSLMMGLAQADTNEIVTGIQKEACFASSTIANQKTIQHNLAGQSKLSEDDKTALDLARATIDSENERLNKLGNRYFKITGHDLSLSGCP